jgi:hypothetical protein
MPRMRVKKDREVDVDIRRKDRKCIIGELLVLCRNILRLMQFPLIACDRQPFQYNNQE